MLADDAILVSGTESHVIRGKAAQVELWEKSFSNANRTIYKRTPSSITLSPIFPLALEVGTWRGGKVDSPGDWAAGSYTAKWRRVNGTWKLEVETYMTTACGGSFCQGAALGS